MIRQPQSDGWRPLLIPTHPSAIKQPQGPMSPMEGVIEELQANQRIEGGIPFGERVRFAS